MVLYWALKGILQLAFAENWPEEDRIKKVEKKPASPRARKVDVDPSPAEAEDEIEEPAPVVKRKTTTRAKPAAKVIKEKKALVRKKKSE